MILSSIKSGLDIVVIYQFVHVPDLGAFAVDCSSHSDHVFDVAWSPTADFLVTASHDRLWKLWQPRVPSLRNSIFTANNHQRYPVSQVNNDVMRAERMAMV